MDRYFITLCLTVSLISSASADTTAFVCKGKNGEKVFSQQPCGKESQSITIKTQEVPKTQMPRSAPLSIGMTEDDVVKLWGRPDQNHQSLYKSGLHEQWVYKDWYGNADYVYFENGKLTAIQLH